MDEQNKKKTQYLKDVAFIFIFIYLSVGTNVYILPQEHAYTQTMFFLK